MCAFMYASYTRFGRKLLVLYVQNQTNRDEKRLTKKQKLLQCSLFGDFKVPKLSAPYIIHCCLLMVNISFEFPTFVIIVSRKFDMFFFLMYN
ncbi:hypothetical protein Hanom_Chr09g00801371 [Helianthus anomalus]